MRLTGPTPNQFTPQTKLAEWKIPSKKAKLSAFETLVDFMRQKAALKSDKLKTNKIVVLQIAVTPDDLILVRNNSHIFKEYNLLAFICSTTPLETFSKPPLAEGLIPEYILQNEVPLSRLKVFSTLDPDRHLQTQLLRDHHLLNWGFFNANRIKPEQKTVVQEALGFDLSKTLSRYSPANRVNPCNMNEILRAPKSQNPKTVPAKPESIPPETKQPESAS